MIDFEKPSNNEYHCIAEFTCEIDEKHIMRYQQLFATLEVRRKIDEDTKGGVIWYTQESVLTDYFATKNTVAKFYFIVDRIDLLEQATGEFGVRRLEVRTANSREELKKKIDMSYQSNDIQDKCNKTCMVNTIIMLPLFYGLSVPRTEVLL